MELKDSPSGVRHYKSQNEYMTAKKAGKALSKAGTEVAKPEALELGDAAKPEISEASKSMASESASNSSSTKSNLVKEATKSLATEALKAGLSQMKPAVAMAKNIAKGRNSIKAAESGKSPKKVEPLRKEPLVIFFNGFEMFSSVNDAGLKKLAEHIPHARTYSWTEEDMAMEEIKKHHPQTPLILAGHSLGSDTAVNIAQSLNTLDNGFRKVDLLVTLDSIGSDNDVIPTNTRKNLNFIGEEQGFFNDGPNIAKDLEQTEVINELRPEGHLDIDNEESVMKKIFEEIMPLIEPLETSLESE